MLSKSSTFSLELMNGTLGTSDIRVGMHNGMKKVFFHFDTPAFSRDVSKLKVKTVRYEFCITVS